MPTEAGNYYLTGDVTINESWSVPSGTTNLCLNGHGIRLATANNNYDSVIFVNVANTLNLYDCGTGTQHRFSLDYTAANGAGHAVVNDALTSGYQTFTGGYITGGRAAQGGAADVYGTFKMYGGNIIGNSTELTGEKAFYDGGAVHVTDGTFALHGGKVMYNTSRGHGGGVYVTSNDGNTGCFVMTGGEVAYNVARGMNDNTFTYGGGGGVCSRYNSGSIEYNLTGGSINHNAGMEWGAGINFTCNNGTLNIGGTLSVTDNYGNEGGVRVSVASNTTNFSGAPVINGNVTKNGTACNFYVNNAATVINVAGELTSTTPIGVTMKTPGAFTDTADTSLNDAGKFASDNTSYAVAKNADGQLALVRAYTVTWKNDDGTVIDTTEVEEGTVPTFTGTCPADYEDEDYTYTFAGWTPEVVAATQDATYTATFTATPKPHNGVNLTVGNDITSNYYVDFAAYTGAQC